MSVKELVDNENVVYTYNGLFSLEGNPIIFYNMNLEDITINKPATKGRILNESTYMRYSLT